MAPRLESLFHPKKKPKQQGQQQPQPNKTSPNPHPKRKLLPPVKRPAEDEDEELKLPDTPFQEFRLLSSALNGWKYDVMRFDSRRPVDIYKWQQPVKLNRKDTRRNDDSVSTTPPVAVGPMLGPDGKPVIGADGKMVMVDADGRPIHTSMGASGSGAGGAGAGAGGLAGKDKDKGKVAAKKRFQKKTRQVFPVAEEVRQLRREERYPWVIEDSSPSQNELWQAQMEEVSKAETHAFFMPAANEVFKFVPAHRWYKFQKKLKHDLPTDLANVESLYNKNQKRDPQQWLASRKGKAPSAATTAMFKAEAEGKEISIGSSLVHSSGQSLGPGGRRLKTVDSGMDHLFDGDDEDGEGARRRKERELGEEGDMDEQVYEEDFADDDEHMAIDDNDEEAKEAEEKMKKEYRSANKQGEAGVDAVEEEEEMPTMSKQAKAMQKLIRNREGNDAYESDEEKNPYASSEEEEEEPEPVVQPTAASAIQEQQQQIESRSQTPKPGAAPARPASTPAGDPGSRATSPALSPGLGGHSIVAKRATSPKIPKPKGVNMSRGNSPLGGQPPLLPSRSTSPALGDNLNGDANQRANLKRKADNSAGSPPGSGAADGQAPKQKKRKSVAPGLSVSSADLENMLLEWLKTTTNASTRDCIQHFTPYLVDAEKKAEFSAMVRRHATLKNGVLVGRAGSSAPSPPAS